MADTQEVTQEVAQEVTASAQPTAEEISEVIIEFEQYRERLLNNTLEAAKKAKLPKKETLAKLEPELAKIDVILDNLRTQHQDLLASPEA